MAVVTDDLISWLRAQLDEDERLAWACRQAMSDSGEWDARDVGSSKQMPSVWRGRYLVARDLSDEDAPHIALHDPARVLAEVDKRRIVDVCAEALLGASHWSTVEASDEVDAILAEKTVRLLALPYADRPGYRDEWRPV